jgi:squalene-hopene/tetraprenyl-beta-curcumene cyclase
MSNRTKKRIGNAYFAETLSDEKFEQAIVRTRDALSALQHPEGFWCFELEADCTIRAKYILMMHYKIFPVVGLGTRSQTAE